MAIRPKAAAAVRSFAERLSRRLSITAVLGMLAVGLAQAAGWFSVQPVSRSQVPIEILRTKPAPIQPHVPDQGSATH